VTALRDHWRRTFPNADPKIICVGLNYYDHAAEQNVEPPTEPILFGKYSNALIGPGEPIVLPPESSHVDAEAELAIVIGRSCRRVSVSDALDVVHGYTVANDVSARDLQFRDGQWLRSKSFDSFLPLLPTTVSVNEVGDASGLRITQRVNGEILQDSSTSNLVFSADRLVSHISAVFTLEPGDIILTGTPAGVGFFRDPRRRLEHGDLVEIAIERLGELRNPVLDQQASGRR
jgi:2-keto-4-pentenoate hydratase/2-oxohepta-3-ene-1,7-dioic acid hydratase in catechol pathway